MIKRFCCLCLLIALTFFPGISCPASQADSTKNERWNYHFQTTVLTQYHPSFKAKYSGAYSLDTNHETTISVTATIFLGLRLWKGAQVYFNPELSGGSGFSQTRGVAGFPNGEVYRVSDPSPHVYIARLYFRQLFALSKTYHRVDDDFNQLSGKEPDSYISLIAGKFSMMDFFDNNSYSHDPRTQFYNWALMGNGAWDYPANTRGYTYGLAMEYVNPSWALRLAFVTLPEVANGSDMQFHILTSNATSLEFEKKYRIGSRKGRFSLLAYLNLGPMGNYQQAIDIGSINDTAPDITKVRANGHTKYGFGINAEQEVGKSVGFFLRSSWNDGNNETWIFTEIDRTLTAGINIGGELWHRDDDNFGSALIVNGISSSHREYLKAGGVGFILGDGTLNYSNEFIFEAYYSFRFFNKFLWISPDYQFILNPGYNQDRGPVHALGIRIHIEI